MSRFITTDDVWGIRQAVYLLWNRNVPTYSYTNNGYHSSIDKGIEFNAFYNQQIPEAWRESLATVKRHIEEIEAVARDPQMQGLVWFVRNCQFNSGYLNDQLAREIKDGNVTPTLQPRPRIFRAHS